MSLLDLFQEHRPFPGHDPWVVAHDGSLLLVQSLGHGRRIVVRQFTDVARMDRNVETVVWAPSGRRGHVQLWAPELHHIDGRWYLYYSASDGSPGGHRTYALVADDALGPYEFLGKVCDPDHDVWAIDLTVFRQGGRLYALWSGWEGPDDHFPQNLYVAPMSNPWTISGERRCVSRPEHGWEMTVAAVNEGPEVLRDPATGRLFVLYAADASWTQAYKMGLLEITGDDVADPASWAKVPHPFFTGGGHGCVIDTPTGAHLVYHRKLDAHPGWADREIRSVPFAFDAEGYPVLPGVAAARAGGTTSFGSLDRPMSAPMPDAPPRPPSPSPDRSEPARPRIAAASRARRRVAPAPSGARGHRPRRALGRQVAAFARFVLAQAVAPARRPQHAETG